jgi:RNA polymerase-binding transcription factor DksA
MVIRFYPGIDGGLPAVERPGLDQFDRRQLQHFRDALWEQRRFRLEQLGQLSRAEPPPSDQLGEVTDALRTAAASALADIDAALDRLRDGSYGRCVRCGTTLLAERLEILPATARCMPCQQVTESSAR